MITQDYLKSLLDYDPATGIFRWKAKRQRIKVGSVAGHDTKGYVAIRIDGKAYPCHRLAWLFIYGKWPAKLIDHKDRDPSNNRISNLREATPSENQMNRGPSKRDLPKGVTRYKNKFRAYLCREYLGQFNSPEEAEMVYNKKAQKLYGEFV